MRTNFHRGEYELASFAAMKAAEVAVREASGLDNRLGGKSWRGGGQEVAHSSERPHPQGSSTVTCSPNLAVFQTS